jgi:hypothetical protein
MKASHRHHRPRLLVDHRRQPTSQAIFGYASDLGDDDVCPFDANRFVDPQARVALLEQLTTDSSVNDYLLRLRRATATRSGSS